MQPRIPGFAALTSLVFLAASDLVVAQITAPNCAAGWEWSFNTFNQDPCTVAAYLMSTCNGGAFEMDPLQPGYAYLGPSGTDDADLCKCNTVVYNLLSACDGCQGQTWITWSQYSFNCSMILSPATFPNPVPAGTRVPQWSLLDTTSVNFWNSTTAIKVGDLPEVLEGDTVGPSGSSTVKTSATGVSGHTAASTGAPTSTSSVVSTPGKSSKKSSHTAAIAGGAAGGVVVLAIIGGLVFYFLRQQRPRPQAPSAAFVVDGGTPAPSMSHLSHMHPPQSDDGATAYMPGTPVTPMKLYDPNDPTTYPGYHGVPTSSPDLHVQVPATPYEASTPTGPPMGGLGGNTLANMQTAQGYHGLPTV